MDMYYVYGFKLISNIPLINATIYCAQPYPNGILYLHFIKKSTPGLIRETSLIINNDESILYLGNYITYYIYTKDMKITAYAMDVAYVESTILNLPFAVLAMSQGALLLHASTLVYNDKLIPFFASKGTGKTTLTAAMSKFFPLFSDDTLYAKLENESIVTYSGSTIMKMYRDSSSMLGLSPISDKTNIQQKGYYRPIKSTNDKFCSGADYKLDVLFFLFREMRKSIEVKDISLQYLKTMNLHINICGVETLGFEYCKYVKSSPLFRKLVSELLFYKLSIPDELNRLHGMAEELAGLIRYML